jgi:predicted adenine nucleotide alpha hydrolase (AANH) superfamily ATPase
MDALSNNKTMAVKKKMLFHTCCANCMLYPVSILSATYDITLFFYNPNIGPEQEYKKRLESVKRAAALSGIDLIAPDYKPDVFTELVSGLKDEPEGGKRCSICFELRLSETAKYAAKNNFDIFSTTLTVSPHKNSQIINSTGRQLSIKYHIDFYAAEFKKQDGFKKTMLLSSKMGIYRQNYCGCIYSIRDIILPG